jgi:hypothetical protein
MPLLTCGAIFLGTVLGGGPGNNPVGETDGGTAGMADKLFLCCLAGKAGGDVSVRVPFSFSTSNATGQGTGGAGVATGVVVSVGRNRRFVKEKIKEHRLTEDSGL